MKFLSKIIYAMLIEYSIGILLTKFNRNARGRNINPGILTNLTLTDNLDLKYYYPSLSKARMITFSDSANEFYNNNTQIPTNDTCNDQHCEVCSMTNKDECILCYTGFFLYKSSCFKYCPEHTVADNLRAKCMPEENIYSMDILYTMAYSFGSCKNMCGKMLTDCNCAATCKKNGTCCTDYDTVKCDEIIQKSKKVECVDNKCELCENVSKSDTNNTESHISNSTKFKAKNDIKCKQCADPFYLHRGKCLQRCPSGKVPDSVNRVCKNDTSDCTSYIENCDKCQTVDLFFPLTNSTKSTLVCKHCKKGNFLLKNECVPTCPEDMKADRMTWSCVKSSVFAWYWIYPSQISCKDNCQRVFAECSCESKCMREGTCCSDYDAYCGDPFSLA